MAVEEVVRVLICLRIKQQGGRCGNVAQAPSGLSPTTFPSSTTPATLQDYATTAPTPRSTYSHLNEYPQPESPVYPPPESSEYPPPKSAKYPPSESPAYPLPIDTPSEEVKSEDPRNLKELTTYKTYSNVKVMGETPNDYIIGLGSFVTSSEIAVAGSRPIIEDLPPPTFPEHRDFVF
uniref:Uncharacterized protein n=1 Tax=Timema bartmani TaxID=61472 RepID=A0A7R9I662_9NEOP|nr:unnamed protein product [Timema bartmani]